MDGCHFWALGFGVCEWMCGFDVLYELGLAAGRPVLVLRFCVLVLFGLVLVNLLFSVC